MFDSLLDNWVGAAGMCSVLSLVLGPILVLLILIRDWKHRGQPVSPLLLSAIPLALTTVTIQLLAAALETTRLFQEFGNLGFQQLADALIDSRHSVMWRAIECAACIVIALVFQMMMRGRGKAVSSDAPTKPSISVRTAVWLGAVTVGAGILVWLYSDTLRFFTLISRDIVGPMDATTTAEARTRLGDMGIGGVAHFLTRRINIVGLSAVLLTLVLLAIGWRLSKRVPVRPVRRWDATASAVLGLIVLGWCGISAAAMAREIDDLRIFKLPPSQRPKVQTPPGPGPNGWAVGERPREPAARNSDRIGSCLRSAPAAWARYIAGTIASSGRDVAIKTLPHEFACDPERLARFRREARTLASLNHPNICTVHDVGPNYLVMELVDGETLREWFWRGLPLERSLGIARQVLEALSAAHRTGVIHRDLKPENVMVRVDGYVKVLDFGLAKWLPTALRPWARHEDRQSLEEGTGPANKDVRRAGGSDEEERSIALGVSGLASAQRVGWP